MLLYWLSIRSNVQLLSTCVRHLLKIAALLLSLILRMFRDEIKHANNTTSVRWEEINSSLQCDHDRSIIDKQSYGLLRFPLYIVRALESRTF